METEKNPVIWMFMSFSLLDDVNMTSFFPPPRRDAPTCMPLFCVMSVNDLQYSCFTKKNTKRCTKIEAKRLSLNT